MDPANYWICYLTALWGCGRLVAASVNGDPYRERPSFPLPGVGSNPTITTTCYKHTVVSSRWGRAVPRFPTLIRLGPWLVGKSSSYRPSKKSLRGWWIASYTCNYTGSSSLSRLPLFPLLTLSPLHLFGWVFLPEFPRFFPSVFRTLRTFRKAVVTNIHL